jgi:hypothetical protein
VLKDVNETPPVLALLPTFPRSPEFVVRITSFVLGALSSKSKTSMNFPSRILADQNKWKLLLDKRILVSPNFSLPQG